MSGPSELDSQTLLWFGIDGDGGSSLPHPSFSHLLGMAYLSLLTITPSHLLGTYYTPDTELGTLYT